MLSLTTLPGFLSGFATGRCVTVTEVPRLVDLDTNTITWIVNGCNETSNNVQVLLNLPGVTATSGAWTVQPVMTTQPDLDACTGDEYANPHETRDCIRKAAETRMTPQSATTNALLPMRIDRPDVSIVPLVKDQTTTITITAPPRAHDDLACSIIDIASSRITIERLILDVSRCSTPHTNSLFTQTLMTQTALLISGASNANITVLDTTTVGGTWAMAIAPTVDNTIFSTSGVEQASLEGASLQVLHIGRNTDRPPGTVIAAAVDKLDVSFRPMADNRLGIFSVILYKTFPGPLNERITLRPHNLVITDISAQAYVPVLASEVTEARAVWECANSISRFGSELSDLAVCNIHDNPSHGGLVGGLVVSSICMVLSAMFVMYAIIHSTFVKHSLDSPSNTQT